MEGLLSLKHLALKLREEGNNLYSALDFEAAIKKYCAAARISQEDPVPLQNLSAAYYETGQYELCIAFAKKALHMTKASGEDDVESHSGKLEARITKAEEHSNATPTREQKKRRIEIMERLGRYHQSTQSENDYCPVSLEDAQSLFEPVMKELVPKDGSFSFFIAGLGDARNFFRSLIHIAYDEPGTISKYRYHFTLNDANRHILARDLIIFKLLDKLSSLSHSGDKSLKVMNTIFFVYAGPIIPECAFLQLQEVISELLESLKGNQQPLKWVHLFENDIPFYIGALENWTTEGQALKTFSKADVVKVVMESMKKYHSVERDDFKEAIGYKCVKERKVYSQSAMLLPPSRIMLLEESFMFDFFTKPGPDGSTCVETSTYELRSWSMNPTMLDLDWHAATGRVNSILGAPYDPFDLARTLVCENIMLSKKMNPSRLFDHVEPFFRAVAKAIKKLGARLQAEVVLGDYIDVAERLNFNLYYDPNDHDESTKLGHPRPKNFPLLYDCITLSNLPDYKGGNLTTFLHALPILKQNRASGIYSICLRNAPVFPNMDYFLSEYQLITSRKMLDKLTGVCIASEGTDPVPLAENTLYKWYPRANNFKRPVGTLLPRKQLRLWFHGLFLKLALPMPSPTPYTPNNHQVSSPLNLSILFHQLAHLRLLGYPSHWLSDILIPLFSSNLTTTTRPPRYSPMEPHHVSTKHPAKQLCIAPFSPEMRNLANIFSPLLPFRLDPNLIYPLDKIHEYKINFRSFLASHNTQTLPTCLILVFWGSGINPNGFRSLEPDNNLRVLLDPSWGDEVNGFCKGEKYENWRAKDVIVWSTFKFDIRKKKVTVWMPQDLVDQMMDGEWKCALWRRDTWRILGAPAKVEAVEVVDMMKMERMWDEDRE
ncbi:hypothetical protein DSL72_000168 [Monilinia vaccinii-corymbosi]|uniref:DUF4470 domain-containing protein n=1 Tax=Monilinia vaccinii-corymbosi TaxID=61207 RepID=A0A8A3P5X8_9HELO|nr:hypothetical protein DSL72_000168 [Monilinia vaccinii-corymbosi]